MNISKETDALVKAAVCKVYDDAELDIDDTPMGIIKLFDLIDYDYPLEVKDVYGLSYRSAYEYLTAEIGHSVQMERTDNTSLSGFLYIHHYQHVHHGYILVDGNEPVVRRRFSAAHELGHYVMHFLPLIENATEEEKSELLILSEGLAFVDEDSNEDSSPQGNLSFTRRGFKDVVEANIAQMEIEANQFAAEILMPEKACRTLTEQLSTKLGTKRSVLARRLSAEFLVSRSAMTLRLAYLSLP